MSEPNSAADTNPSSNNPQLNSAEGELEPKALQPSDLDSALTESTRRPLWGIAKKALGDASMRISSTGAAMASKTASVGTSGVAKVSELGQQAFAGANAAVEATGAKETIKATASVVSEKLDEVSGKRLVELLEQKLRVQDSYNDILATRLAEALDRISKLEIRVNQISSEP